MASTKQIINTTRQMALATEVRVANNYFTRLKGLMFDPYIAENAGLWITPCADIHSCFMRFRFDAVFVNKDLKVLHLMSEMKPWRVSRFVLGSHAVLELPAGVIAKTQTQIGDQLAWGD